MLGVVGIDWEVVVVVEDVEVSASDVENAPSKIAFCSNFARFSGGMRGDSEVENGLSSAKVALLVATRMTDGSEVECKFSELESLRGLLDSVDSMIGDSDEEVDNSDDENGTSVVVASAAVHSPSFTGWRFLIGLLPLRLLCLLPFLLLGWLPFRLLFLFPLRILGGMLSTGLKVVSSVVDDKEALSVVRFMARLDSKVVVEVVAGSVEEVEVSSSKFSNSVGGILLPPDTLTTS